MVTGSKRKTGDLNGYKNELKNSSGIRESGGDIGFGSGGKALAKGGGAEGYLITERVGGDDILIAVNAPCGIE